MSVRLHMIEDAAKYLGGELTAVMVKHFALQIAGGLTPQENASATLSGIGFNASSALKAILCLAKPEVRGPMYDEAVERLVSILVAAKPETLAFAEEIGPKSDNASAARADAL